jgi:hypothetical protein
MLIGSYEIFAQTNLVNRTKASSDRPDLADEKNRRVLDEEEKKNSSAGFVEKDTVELSEEAIAALQKEDQRKRLVARHEHMGPAEVKEEPLFSGNEKPEEVFPEDEQEKNLPFDEGNIGKTPAKMTDAEKRELEELKETDREVRVNEMAHLAAAGELARGGIEYEYEMGPDGRNYVVDGKVNIVIPEGETPEESARLAKKARRAAMAAAKLSAEDIALAARASRAVIEAQAKIAVEKMSGGDGRNSLESGAALQSSDGIQLREMKPEATQAAQDASRAYKDIEEKGSYPILDKLFA